MDHQQFFLCIPAVQIRKRRMHGKGIVQRQNSRGVARRLGSPAQTGPGRVARGWHSRQAIQRTTQQNNHQTFAQCIGRHGRCSKSQSRRNTADHGRHCGTGQPLQRRAARKTSLQAWVIGGGHGSYLR